MSHKDHYRANFYLVSYENDIGKSDFPQQTNNFLLYAIDTVIKQLP